MKSATEAAAAWEIAARRGASNYTTNLGRALALRDCLEATKRERGLTLEELWEERSRDAFVRGEIDACELEERLGYEGTFR